MVRDNNSDLYREQQKLLAELRSIVGNKRLEFSESYIKARKDGHPRLGRCGNDMIYHGVTRQSVLCPCRVVYSNDPLGKEYGAYIKKYSLFKYFDGQNVKKIPLEDLFVEDLKQVVGDIKFFLWWEAESHFPSVEKLYKETLALKERYEKFIETK
jgi:hypothetical protein